MHDQLVAEIFKTWPGAVVKMKEPNKFEIEGMYEGAARGGEYLETIGKTDVATMTEDQWMSFIEVVVRGYEEKTMELYGDPPFAPVD